jgi:dsRNA-specific ribonuclease
MEKNKYLPTPIQFSQYKFRAIKILGDVFESLVGAIYVDTNFNYEATKTVLMNKIKSFIDHFASMSFVSQSPSFKYKEYLDHNNYKNIKIVKNVV